MLGIYGQYHVVRGNRILWGGNSGVGGSSIGLRLRAQLAGLQRLAEFRCRLARRGHQAHPRQRRPRRCATTKSATTASPASGTTPTTRATASSGTTATTTPPSACSTSSASATPSSTTWSTTTSAWAWASAIRSEDTRLPQHLLQQRRQRHLLPLGRPAPEELAAGLRAAEGRVRRQARRAPLPRPHPLPARKALPRLRGEVHLVVSRRHASWPRAGCFENVSFDNWGWGGVEINQPVCYSQGVAVDPELVNTFDRNIYWNPFSTRIFTNGRYCSPELDLAQWQELSGQDRHSRWLNPLDHPRGDAAVVQGAVPLQQGRHAADPPGAHRVHPPRSKDGVAKTILMSRLIRSKTHRAGEVRRPHALRAVLRRRRQALRERSGAAARRCGTCSSARAARVTVENKFAARKEIEVRQRPAEPVTWARSRSRSIGFDGPTARGPQRAHRGAAVDRARQAGDRPRSSCKTSGRRRNGHRPATQRGPALGGLSRRTSSRSSRAARRPRSPWCCGPSGKSGRAPSPCGSTGTAGTAKLDQAKYFGVGYSLALKHVQHTPRLDGRFLPWVDTAAQRRADTRGQVVAGAENWRGPDDLSAKVWLAWSAGAGAVLRHRRDRRRGCVTNHRDDDPDQVGQRGTVRRTSGRRGSST